MAGMIPLFLAEESEESLARERVFRDRNDPLEFYNDLELVQRSHFSRSAILRITQFIFDRLNSTDRSHAAHTHVQVCGDGVHVSQPSACRYIRAVALGLQSIYSKFIRMPGSTNKATIKSQFYELAHLPGVLGLVDGTHVRIQKPSENEADYIKTFLSLHKCSRYLSP